MSECNFGWTHTCGVMVWLGFLWWEWQQGPHLIFGLDSVFYLEQDPSPAVQKHQMKSLKQHCHVCWVSPFLRSQSILSCNHWQTNGDRAALGSFLSPSWAFFFFSWWLSSETDFVRKTANFSTAQVQYLEMSWLFGLGRTNVAEQGQVDGVDSHLLKIGFVQLGAAASGNERLCFLSKCLICPVQNVHTGRLDPGQNLYKPKSYKLYCWPTGNHWAAGDKRNPHHTEKEVVCVTAVAWRVIFCIFSARGTSVLHLEMNLMALDLS